MTASVGLLVRRTAPGAAPLVLAALLIGGPAAAGESRSAAATGDQDESPPTCVTLKVIQESELGGLKSEATYDAWFKGRSFCRVQGKHSMADGQIEFDVTMVSDGKTLRQLSATSYLKQFLTYDLRELRKVYPEFDATAGYNPLTYRDALKHLGSRGKGMVQLLDGEKTTVYEWPMAGTLNMGGVPGLPSGMTRVKKVKVWVAAKDGLPRKVEAYDDSGMLFMSTRFKDVQLVPSIPADRFTLERPEDAMEIDGTEVMLDILKGMEAKKE